MPGGKLLLPESERLAFRAWGGKDWPFFAAMNANPRVMRFFPAGMTEGATACLEHGFARLGLDRVYSFTACVNLPSQAVMQRAGMRKTAEFNHPKVAPDSVLYPHVLYVREASHA